MEKKPRIFKTLDEFLNEYPEDKYLRVFPTLAVSEELPDYITFAAHTLPFEDPPTKAVARGDEPDRSDTYWIEDPKPAKGQWSADPGWISFTRHGLDRIALAMGIQWIEEVRIDNQRDPMVCTYRAHGSLSFITGARSEIQVYRLDLHVREDKKRKDTWNYPPKNAQVRGKWLWWKSQDGVLASPEVQEQIVESRVEDYILQLRDVIEQRAQTGARSRVIRAFSGLPNKFRPGRLMEKPLAILQVIYRPRPQTSEERMHLHGILAGVYSGGYPGQGQIAQTVRPQLTEGSREIVLPVGEELKAEGFPCIACAGDLHFSPGDGYLAHCVSHRLREMP